MNQTSHLLALAVLAGVSAQAADRYIKLTGATAFRSFAHEGIKQTFDADPPVSVVGTPTAGQQSFRGRIAAKFGTDDVYVFAAYSGSVQGLKDLLNGTQLTYAAVGEVLPPVGSRGADAAFMDIDPANAPVSLNVEPLEGSGDILGVQPFVWVRNSHSDAASLTSISQQAASALFGQGFAPLELVTGLSADAGKFVVVAGRATSSGTRVITLTEIQRRPNDVIKQYALDPSNQWKEADSLVNGSTIRDDDGLGAGYQGGGNLKTAIVTDGTDYPAIAMMSVGEAIDGASIMGAALKYNGVPYTKETLLSGAYTFWGYERLIYKDGAAADTTDFGRWYALFRTKLEAELNLEVATTIPRAYSLGAMGTVVRGSDGAPVTK